MERPLEKVLVGACVCSANAHLGRLCDHTERGRKRGGGWVAKGPLLGSGLLCEMALSVAVVFVLAEALFTTWHVGIPTREGGRGREGEGGRGEEEKGAALYTNISDMLKPPEHAHTCTHTQHTHAYMCKPPV